MSRMLFVESDIRFLRYISIVSTRRSSMGDQTEVKRKVDFPLPLGTVMLAIDLGISEWFAS